jgi:hypothetical protein
MFLKPLARLFSLRAPAAAAAGGYGPYGVYYRAITCH